MPLSETKLAEMLCTRLCHDLTGPIGAVNNGAEFLQDEMSGMESEALQLVVGSAMEAVHRLQFYRLAYGRVNEHGEACLAEQKQVVEEMFSSTKIQVDWPATSADAANISISQKMSRLILNLLIISAATLIRGGKIAVRLTVDDDGKRHVSVKALGDVIKMDEDVLQVLRREVNITQLNPKTAQLALTLKLAEEVDAQLEFTLGDGQFAVEATQACAEALQPTPA